MPINHHAHSYLQTLVDAITVGITTIYAPVDGELVAAHVKCKGTNPATNPAIFDVNKEGATIFADPADRIEIAAGASLGSATGLSVACAKFDKFTFDLDGPLPTNAFGEDLVFELVFEERATRQSVAIVTTSIANGAVFTGAAALGNTFTIESVESSHAAELRLYRTAAFRTADASRPATDKPTGEHGLIYQHTFTASKLAWKCSPEPIGSSADDPATGDVYVSIKNLSGSTATITIEFTVVELEL